MSTVSPRAFLSLSCLPSLLSSLALLSQVLGELENQQHLAQPDPFRGSPALHTVVLGKQQHPPVGARRPLHSSVRTPLK